MRTKLKMNRKILISTLFVLFIVSIIPVLADESTGIDLTVTILAPPVADAGGPYSGRRGRAIEFDGTYSDDPDGTIDKYSWDFDASDGIQEDAIGSNPSHIYYSTGTYTVTLTVTDNDGLTDSDTADVYVSKTPPTPPVNKKPKADAGPNVKISVGSIIYFSGEGSYDPDGKIVSYRWDFGDGAKASGMDVSHSYSESGHYTVTLTVKDERGAEDSDKCHVKVWEHPVHVRNRFGELVSGGKKGHVVDASDMANTTVTLNTTEPVTVTVLVYDDNPYPEDPIPATALPIYVDVEVSNSSAVEWPIYVEMFYTDEEVIGLDESTFGIYYWMDGAWQRCSDTGVETVLNIVWAYMTAEEASGSPIVIAGMHAIITPPLPPFLDNLNITPAVIELGDNVTISVDIRNPNDGAIGYGFTMEVEEPIWIHIPWNAWTELVFVELEAYESKTVSRTMTPTVVGTHNVTVIGMTGNFTVKAPPKPAEFVVSDLSITPEEFELGEGVDVWSFRITVDVENVGEQEGTHTVDLKVDGEVIQDGTVILWGGEGTMIVFDVTRGVGVYIVEVEGLTGSFTLKAHPKPAEFLFSGLEVTPMEVEEGLKVTVTVDISNVGELEGGRTVELKVDGYVVDSEEVILEGGESVMVLFDLTRDEGTYKVEVEGMTDSFTVFTLPVAPPIWMRPGTIAGIIIVAAVLIVYAYWKEIIPSPFPRIRTEK